MDGVIASERVDAPVNKHAVLEAHTRIGTPSQYLDPARTFVIEEQRVKALQFQRAKEVAEIGRAETAAVDQIASASIRDVEALNVARKRDLDALDAEIRKASEPPVRRIGETDSEFSGRLTTAQIREAQAGKRAQWAIADIGFVNQTNEANEVATMADEWFRDPDADTARRVLRACVARLRALAVEDRRQNGDSAVGSATFRAFTDTEARFKTWSKEQAQRSPVARRDAINNDFDVQVQQSQTTARRLAESMGWLEQFERAVRAKRR